MKKIEIINKVTEINVEVVELLEKTDDNIEDAFKSFIEKFYSEFGGYSDNFRSVMSYYHGGKRIGDFISGVNYYMNTMDADDITYYDAMEDLKIMKKLYKLIKEFVENYDDEEEIKTVEMPDDCVVRYYGINNKEKFDKLPEYKQIENEKKNSLYSTNMIKIKINKYTTFNVEMFISKYQAYNYCIGTFGEWNMDGELLWDAFRNFRKNENIKTIKDLKDYLKKNDNKIFFKYYGKDFGEIYCK